MTLLDFSRLNFQYSDISIDTRVCNPCNTFSEETSICNPCNTVYDKTLIIKRIWLLYLTFPLIWPFVKNKKYALGLTGLHNVAVLGNYWI